MTKEEIKEYLNRVDKLLDKLKGEDKETLSWLIYGYNQCAKSLNETQKENEKLKAEYGTKAQVERDFLNEENEKYKEVIDRKKYLLKEQGAELKELYSEIDKLQGGIDKAIKLIEDTYYSKNTTDIDSIVLSNDKLIKVRRILKEVE